MEKFQKFVKGLLILGVIASVIFLFLNLYSGFTEDFLADTLTFLFVPVVMVFINSKSYLRSKKQMEKFNFGKNFVFGFLFGIPITLLGIWISSWTLSGDMDGFGIALAYIFMPVIIILLSLVIATVFYLIYNKNVIKFNSDSN